MESEIFAFVGVPLKVEIQIDTCMRCMRDKLHDAARCTLLLTHRVSCRRQFRSTIYCYPQHAIELLRLVLAAFNPKHYRSVQHAVIHSSLLWFCQRHHLLERVAHNKHAWTYNSSRVDDIIFGSWCQFLSCEAHIIFRAYNNCIHAKYATRLDRANKQAQP